MLKQGIQQADISVDELTHSLVKDDPGPVSRLFKMRALEVPKIVWNPTPDVTGLRKLDFLIGYWRDAWRDDEPPGCDAIDPVTLKPVLGHVLICEPVDAGKDFLIRLYGTNMAQHMGRDLTGMRVSQFQPESYISDFYLATYRAVTSRGEPLFTHHWPSAEAFADEIPRLLLPFSENGKVTRILACADAIPRKPSVRRGWEINSQDDYR